MSFWKKKNRPALPALNAKPPWCADRKEGSLRALADWLNEEARRSFVERQDHQETIYLVVQYGEFKKLEFAGSLHSEENTVLVIAESERLNSYGSVAVEIVWYRPAPFANLPEGFRSDGLYAKALLVHSFSRYRAISRFSPILPGPSGLSLGPWAVLHESDVDIAGATIADRNPSIGQGTRPLPRPYRTDFLFVDDLDDGEARFEIAFVGHVRVTRDGYSWEGDVFETYDYEPGEAIWSTSTPRLFDALTELADLREIDPNDLFDQLLQEASPGRFHELLLAEHNLGSHDENPVWASDRESAFEQRIQIGPIKCGFTGMLLDVVDVGFTSGTWTISLYCHGEDRPELDYMTARSVRELFEGPFDCNCIEMWLPWTFEELSKELVRWDVNWSFYLEKLL